MNGCFIHYIRKRAFAGHWVGLFVSKNGPNFNFATNHESLYEDVPTGGNGRTPDWGCLRESDFKGNRYFPRLAELKFEEKCLVGTIHA